MGGDSRIFCSGTHESVTRSQSKHDNQRNFSVLPCSHHNAGILSFGRSTFAEGAATHHLHTCAFRARVVNMSCRMIGASLVLQLSRIEVLKMHGLND